MNTDELVIQEAGMAKLEDVCHWFGLSPTEAVKKASKQDLPVPVFKIGSRKSPWLVDRKALAEHIRQCKIEGEDEHRALNAG